MYLQISNLEVPRALKVHSLERMGDAWVARLRENSAAHEMLECSRNDIVLRTLPLRKTVHASPAKLDIESVSLLLCG